MVNKTTSILWYGRNLLKHVFGNGPVRRAPIEKLLELYFAENYRYGICGAERIASKLSQLSSRVMQYTEPGRRRARTMEEIGALLGSKSASSPRNTRIRHLRSPKGDRWRRRSYTPRSGPDGDLRIHGLDHDTQFLIGAKVK